MARHSRRSTRTIEDLPSLFDNEQPDEHIFGDPSDACGVAVQQTSDPDDLELPPSFAASPDRLRFLSLGSGSSGNCYYVGTPQHGILIDAGVNNRDVAARLKANGIDIATIHGLFLTHDHADHVSHAYALLRQFRHLRLYCTLRTLEGLLMRHRISRRIREYHYPIFKEHQYAFDNFAIIPFETMHDGSDNCGFAIKAANTTFVIATDTGKITERADYYLRQADAIMIETDYDDFMLEHGRYGEHLKARIRSEKGHLDNATAAQYITKIYSPRLKYLFLCHLSENHNTPETAMATMQNALRTIGIRPATSSADIPRGRIFITALPRFAASDLYVF